MRLRRYFCHVIRPRVRRQGGEGPRRNRARGRRTGQLYRLCREPSRGSASSAWISTWHNVELDRTFVNPSRADSRAPMSAATEHGRNESASGVVPTYRYPESISRNTSVCWPHQVQSQTRLTWAAHFGLLCLLCGWISSINRVSPDLYHEMALAREALAIGYLPEEDIFAYTPTVHPERASRMGCRSTLVYALSMGLGSSGLILIKYVGAVLVGWGCLRLARRRGADDSVATVLAPSGTRVRMYWLPHSARSVVHTGRSQPSLLHLLESDRQGRQWWPIIWLPLYVVWLNMHAGFLVGVGLFVLYAMGRWYESWRTERSGTGGRCGPNCIWWWSAWR